MGTFQDFLKMLEVLLQLSLLCLIFTMPKNFPLRYYMTLYLKGYQKCDKSILKVHIEGHQEAKEPFKYDKPFKNDYKCNECNLYFSTVT